MEQCRQGKSAKWIRNFGKRIGSEAGHGGPSPEPVGCRWTARAASAARAGRRVPAGGRTGNGSPGAFPASNSRLRTEISCGTKKGKSSLILIFSTNTNRESVAYRSFRPSEFEARGVRKVTTGITGLWQPAFIATLLFDPSMSALPIIVKQNSPSVDCSPTNRERELGLDRRETG
ncbi:hypothetical protein Dsin_032980 [Dipteronia sinensis]|uniref:Uncharacterized protein n=1 Tax=Dipteronia sinensis TaxID=43782 RepID=A0AAD9ZG69_9ROSI|nr:hypothetical protein Dsin_032980 [Dipteronia sinensis]